MKLKNLNKIEEFKMKLKNLNKIEEFKWNWRI